MLYEVITDLPIVVMHRAEAVLHVADAGADVHNETLVRSEDFLRWNVV